MATSNPLLLDPSRTSLLRQRFVAEVRKRFARLKAKVLRLIDSEDALGIRADSKSGHVAVNELNIETVRDGSANDARDKRAVTDNYRADIVTNTRWRFLSSADKARAFAEWLAGEITDEILKKSISESQNEWWLKFIAEGYKKGAGRAFDDVRKPGRTATSQQSVSDFYRGTKDEFLRSSFGHPESLEKVKLLASRVFTDLKGVTEEMATQMKRILVEGLVQGQNPREMARALANRVDKIGKTRAILIARTEIIRAHAEGQLDSLEKLGVAEVNVAVEWSTAKDERVCPKCQPLQGMVLSIKQARGMIPRHPACRCAWVPANVGEGKVGQKRTKEAVKAAQDASIKAEIPKRSKRTLAQQKLASSWGGARKTLQNAPRSILDPPDDKKPVQKPPVLPPVPPIAPPDATKATIPPESRPQRAPEPKPGKGFPGSERVAPDRSKPLEERLKSPEVQQIRTEMVRVAGDTDERVKQLEKEKEKLWKTFYAEGNRWNYIYKTAGPNDPRLAALQSNQRFIHDKIEAVEKQLTPSVKSLKDQVAGAIGLALADRLSIQMAKSDSKSVTTTSGKSFELETPSDTFLEKMSEAVQFLESISARIGGRLRNATGTYYHQTPVKSRAFYSPGFGKDSGIYLTDKHGVKVFVHELGHHLEKDLRDVQQMANEFLEMRLARSGTKNVKMADVCPECGYRDDEIGNEDDFRKLFGDNAPYVGKRYSDGSTEVISMGLEKLYEDPIKFAETDPEYFDFIVGVLRGLL